jgi:hypothetical protein
METLAFRGVVDLPPQAVLDSFTTTELIAEVQRAVVGPTTWFPRSSSPWIPRSSSPPTPAWQHSVTTPPDFDSSTLLDLRLLPGGRYILLQLYTSLQFWEISSGKLVWTRQMNYIYGAVSDSRDGGLSARVLIYKAFTWYVRSSCPSKYHEFYALPGTWRSTSSKLTSRLATRRTFSI